MQLQPLDQPFKVARKSVVVVFVRHRQNCDKKHYGDNHRGCDCPKFLRYSVTGNGQLRQSAQTRSWTIAESKAKELEAKLNGSPLSLSSAAPNKATAPTITQLIQSFIGDKEASNVGRDFIDALRSQLNRLEHFMAARSKFHAADITRQDVSEFRASWASGWQKYKAWGPLKRSKAQTNYKSFLKHASRSDLLDAFPKIKYGQSKPKPLTAEQVKKLLAQIPITFAASPDKIARVSAFVKAAISMGSACIDTVLLERSALEKATNGVLRYERRKTGRIATPKIDASLRHELLDVMNGNPRYVFWGGEGNLDSAVKAWADDVRQLFKDAEIYTKGDLTHRFRDTAVDFWFSEGCNSTEVADMAGDTVAIIEKHYKDYCSKGRETHISKLPARTW